MKERDQQVRRIVRLMNLPVYELELNLIPREGAVITCPPEVESMIGRFYRSLNMEKLHQAGKLCHIVLPMQLHELLVPMKTNYLLLGPFLLEALEQSEFELLLLNAGLDASQPMLQYFQTLTYLPAAHFEEFTALFSELLETETETVSFASDANHATLMQRILLSAAEEETRERASEYYTACARALSFREMDQLRTCGEKWAAFIETAPPSAYSFLKEMVYNEYILMCSTYHETVQFQAAPFIAYLRQRLNACGNQRELAVFHREMLAAFQQRLDLDAPLHLPGAIRAVRRYIRSHYKESLKLADLARQAELSPAYLSARFLQCCGVSITDYILSCRVEQAKRLLLYSTLSIGDIAGLCGFADAGYFTKRFKKIENVLPEEYRRNHGQKGR